MTRRPGADELALWQWAMRDVTPLGERPKMPELPRNRLPLLRDAAAPEIDHGPARPAPGRLGVKATRRIATGRQAIDTVIDLHGLTQARAFQILETRLPAARRAGNKTVLVVTGKGAPQAAPHHDPAETPRGILRRAVPQWLETPPLSSHVAAVSKAGPRHGGDGALYVVLRKA